MKQQEFADQEIMKRLLTIEEAPKIKFPTAAVVAPPKIS
jgi:hypothetical protein